MIIDSIKLLKKIIAMQFSVIEGETLKAILHKETSFFIGESGAKVIAVCIETEEGVEIELILEEKHKFLSLLRKYKLMAKHMELNRFMGQCNSHFVKSHQHVELTGLHAIFDGHLSKKNTAAFEKEMDFDRALLYPMRNNHDKKIGLIIYLYSKDSEKKVGNLLQLTEAFSLLIRPFYDDKRRILRAKCVQIDDQMQRLTEKERQITKRVVLGKPYKEIAEELEISINTLKTHMKNIFSKYGVTSKIELHNKLTGSF